MDFRVEPDRKYTETHEWVQMADGMIVLGVSDFAQHQLSDIVYIELPQTGESVEKGNVLVTLESVKAVGEVYAPVSGDITSVNKALEEHPELVNTDPYGQGWLVKLTPRNPDEVNALMDAAAYSQYLTTAR